MSFPIPGESLRMAYLLGLRLVGFVRFGRGRAIQMVTKTEWKALAQAVWEETGSTYNGELGMNC